MENFELPKREVSVNELDQLVKDLKTARTRYDKAKAISSELHGQMEKLEMKLVDLLNEAGKSIYEVEGVARVTVVSKTQVTTPKTIEDKKLFFEWVKSKLGEEGLIAYQTVNYQSLNSLYNKEMEAAVLRGEEFKVPGLALPMVVKSLSVRSK